MYLNIIANFSDIIKGQFFAHQHSDSYYLFYDSLGNVNNVLFSTPSITPWKTTLDNVTANNPSVRLISFNRTTYQPTNYTQFYANLSKANQEGVMVWQIEYNTQIDYQLSSLDSLNFANLTSRLEQDDSVLQKYHKFNAVSYPQPACNSLCKTRHLCAIRNIRFADYFYCINYSPKDTPTFSLTWWMWTLIVIGGLGVILILCYFVWTRLRVKHDYTLINDA